ncbi:MAG: DNA polymerase/3'-5' exonuclease PolX [Candidatus Liptonbacteria bacterium]|nr:DNA polymerase/3'-5' exonuclease PolX [Candidatus Liptonbacteria bacterium]
MVIKPIKNAEIVKALKEFSAYLAAEGVAFKPRAYEKAALGLEGMEEELAEIYKKGGRKALEDLPGVGRGIAERIEELFKTGKVNDLERLRKKYPVKINEITEVEGIGPKMALNLYKKLGVKTLADLEKSAKAGKVRNIEGFGQKTEENILKGIEFVKKSGSRFLLGLALPEIRKIEERLKNLKEVERLTVAGSVRRWKETIGDADILVISKNPKPIMDYFVGMPEVVRVYAHGETKSAVKIKSGLDIDLRVVEARSYGAALNYFTGSKDHNIALREEALKKELKLNEYGLFRGKKMVAGRGEVELYEALGMDYIEPEMRENTGEIELSKKHALPSLINYGDIEGDLQIQTDWTDGSDSIEEMAKAALSQGLKYIAITDHTKRLAMTGGLDEKKIRRQWADIDRIQKKMGSKIKILKGTECDILKDGSLDLPDEILAKLDVVGVSVHSYFNLFREEQTKRILKAIKNPYVDILFHPTGRLINRREPYEVDMEAIIKEAKQTGTVLEIDAFPDRLDLKDEHIKKCVISGVKMSIDSDAHSVSHFPFLEYGIAQARRGWAKRGDIINAWPAQKMMSFLKSRH